MNLASPRDIVYIATENAAITALRSFYIQGVDGAGDKEFHKIRPRVLPVEEGWMGEVNMGWGRKGKRRYTS